MVTENGRRRVRDEGLQRVCLGRREHKMLLEKGLESFLLYDNVTMLVYIV